MESDQTVDERPTLYLHCGAAQAQGSRGYQQDALSFVDNGLMAEGEAAAMAEPSPVAEKEGARRHAIIGVFDGHGSESYARHASENIHRHIVEDKAFTEGNFPLALANGFLAEDRELYQTVHVEEKRGGTTATVALIVDDMLFIANVGDSRAVLAERGEGTDFFAIRVSQDHKPSVPKEQVRLQNTEAIVSQGRVHTRTHSLNMTRALGDFAFKAPANEKEADWVSSAPTIVRVQLQPGHQFLVLASDGLWDYVQDEDIVEWIADRKEEGISPQQAAELLCGKLGQMQGSDNITVVCVFFEWQT